ncbi:integral membrane protein [Lophiotrema nucula]|uniref:Integral membrane protein n=1 Tax=Lophiotrema nucula TaxID=690887 RepID=A0A6A5Z714_9PLEO|nr:integral membrane protein [Lophiotrema nucula]
MSGRFFTGFLVFFSLFALYTLHSYSSRDPTSLFFNPRVGYAPAYSELRRQQAEQFITLVSNSSGNHDALGLGNSESRKICVGIPSIARKGARYLRTAVGSLLEGLTPEERKEIYFVVFIAQTDPTVHPAYKEHWLEALTDDILVYDIPNEDLDRIKNMEKEAGLFREKGLFDYSFLLQACYEHETPYIAVFEDDIVAMDGWYYRTMKGLELAETQSALRGSPDFLYLRLFYTEEFLGWNSEEWLTYAFWSILFIVVPTGVLLFLHNKSAQLKRIPPNRLIMFSTGVCLTIIVLFFSIGRATVLPLPVGVNYMPKYGCCSQGFVFPRQKALTMASYYTSRKTGFVDVLTEEYADQHNELRWAITPSVIQHVGRKSSKVDDYGPGSKHGLSVAETIWNFEFERNNVDDLRREHDEAVGRKHGTT